jgi:hypothetical protein
MNQYASFTQNNQMTLLSNNHSMIDYKPTYKLLYLVTSEIEAMIMPIHLRN